MYKKENIDIQNQSEILQALETAEVSETSYEVLSSDDSIPCSLNVDHSDGFTEEFVSQAKAYMKYLDFLHSEYSPLSITRQYPPTKYSEGIGRNRIRYKRSNSEAFPEEILLTHRGNKRVKFSDEVPGRELATYYDNQPYPDSESETSTVVLSDSAESDVGNMMDFYEASCSKLKHESLKSESLSESLKSELQKSELSPENTMKKPGKRKV